MPFALVLSLILSQQDVRVHYSAPRDAAKQELAKYELLTWKPGDALCIAVDQANLRAQPKEDAPVVATLPMAAPVTVKQLVGERVKVSDRVDSWYQVDAKGADGQPLTAYLFGNVLTQACYEEDLDGDGEKELITVAMTADFKIRVRVMEPKLPPPQRVASAEVEPAGQFYAGVVGGGAKVKWVKAKKAGVPLIQVDSRPERCSDYSTTYFSYVVPGAKPGVLGKVKVAIDLGGHVDPPSVSSYEVSFQPGKRKLTVVRTSTEEDKDGNEDKEVSRRHYQWKDGVYEELKK